jgi:predicted kinase
MKDLILLRGLPGAGKSTLADTITTDAISADMFFEDVITKEYKFDGARIKDAHRWCQDLCKRQMKFGHTKIVVANTFTREWEMDAYYELAEKYGYRVYSVIVENRHDSMNVHGVPEDKLEIMKNRFEIKL